jgi:hypothetical protein
MSSIFLGILRHVLTGFGAAYAATDADIGMLITQWIAAITNADPGAILGTSLAVIATCFSIFDKLNRAKKERQAREAKQ